MAKTTKRSKHHAPAKRVQLTSDEVVERDMRRSAKRLKRIGRLQRQIQRELSKNRRDLSELVEWLIAAGHADPPPVELHGATQK